MKAAFSLVVALAVAVAVLPAPAAPPAELHGPPAPAEPAPAPRPKESPFAYTAIGAVIDANGGRLPASGVELNEALKKLGDFIHLSFPFSSVALNSGLAHPRVVIAMRPTPISQQLPFSPPGGWGGGSSGPGRIVNTPLPSLPPDRYNLEGRLYLAANMEPGAQADSPRVKTIEFISWNTRRTKFDFGVIENLGATPEIKFLDGARCFSCHKNQGPILGVGPWSNSNNNGIVRTMSSALFKFDTVLSAKGEEQPTDRVDGMALATSNGPDVDQAVRVGAEILRNREIFKALTRTADGRKALVLLMTAIVERGSLEKIDRRHRVDLNNYNLVRFMQDSLAIQRSTPSSFLADYSPSGSMGRVTGSKISWGGSEKLVSKYDAAREAGEHGMPSKHLPSNPRAFLKPPVKVSSQPSDFVSAVMLARTIGLTEGDRNFLIDELEGAAPRLQKPDGPAVTVQHVARQVFTGPSFADVLTAGGELPDRDDFKDRFAAGLLELLRARGDWSPRLQKREQFTISPRVVPGSTDREIEVVPSTACLRCHDVRGPGKAAFSPIPQLAFDPFDRTAREAWLRTAERKPKIETLTRLVKRLATDKDMPPEDSAEAELFRAQDPESFDALRDWLEAELKKAKGS